VLLVAVRAEDDSSAGLGELERVVQQIHQRRRHADVFTTEDVAPQGYPLGVLD
jgi:hypothetical protein